MKARRAVGRTYAANRGRVLRAPAQADRVQIIFASKSWEDYLYWQKTDRRIVTRIHSLIKEICRSPFRGTGKPEPLKNALAGYWPRRINEEHRLVYRVEGDALFIVQARYHY